MDLGLNGKRFVVGGGSKGLGLAVGVELAKEGAKVLLLSRDEQVLGKAAAGIGPNASYAVIDISEPGAAETVAAAVDAQLGGLDGVLVNAGGPPPGEVLKLTDEQWVQSFHLLVGGPIRLLRTLVPKMTDGGSILFITSSSVRQPIPNLDSSNVLRPGVAAMAKTLARELGPAIRVNSIAPGRFDTERLREVYPDGPSESDLAAIPLRRLGQPEEIGDLVCFLASDRAAYITGTLIAVDGGLTRGLL